MFRLLHLSRSFSDFVSSSRSGQKRKQEQTKKTRIFHSYVLISQLNDIFIRFAHDSLLFPFRSKL